MRIPGTCATAKTYKAMNSNHPISASSSGLMEIHDISMEVSEGMLTYPGNPKVRIRRYASMPKAENNLSIITMGSHTGTHADSELHIRNKGKGADTLPLSSLYGRARVLDLSMRGNSIGEEELSGNGISRGDIILVKSNNSRKQYRSFRRDYAHISPSGARYLVSRKVRTLGVDYLSVKKPYGDDVVHEMLIRNMTVFEGLVLKGIKAGTYTFAGLPLKIGCDGSPARALLISR